MTKPCFHLTEQERAALIQKRLPLRVLALVLRKWKGRQIPQGRKAS